MIVYDKRIKSTKHHVSALLILCVAVIAGSYATGSLQGMLLPVEVEESNMETLLLGIEAPEATTVVFDFYTKGNSAVFNVSHNAKQPIYVSLPETWWRREVRNTALDRVIADSAGLQVKRWRIPVNAEVSYAVPSVPGSLEVANPQQKPVMVNMEYIDVAAGTVDRNSVLVKGRGEVWRK